MSGGVRGRMGDPSSLLDYSQEYAGPQNRRPPGYEPSSCRASLRSQFHRSEGAPSSTVCLSPARFVTESKCEVTSRVASRQG